MQLSFQAKALAGAEKVLSETYQVAYVQHAPMEPRAAVTEWTDDGLTVWTGTQQPLPPALAVLHRNLKRAFDPQGLFNPGRLYPDL